MELLDRIINAKDLEEVKEIVDKELEIKSSNAHKVDQLGMINSINSTKPFEGFIPYETRIKYNNLGMESYSMNTKDFFYDFSKFIKDCNINKPGMLIASLESFINSYFGMGHKNSRESIFNDIAWNNTETDEEYFQALENNKIGDLKGQNAAECTERAAVAQQILSLFGFETYYCMGCIKTDKLEEAHAFNIVKSKNGYVVVDYSVPVACFDNDGKVKGYFPFTGEISNQEFEEFIQGGNLKEFANYEYDNISKKNKLDSKREYVIGEFKITKEDVY